MPPATSTDLRAYSIALGDDALVLGQRLADGQPCAVAEEDLRSRTYRSITSAARACSTLRRGGRGGWQRRRFDRVGRDTRAFTNLLINELPRGDFAFTMVRQFLVDAFNVPFLTALAAQRTSACGHRREALKESTYHLRRSRDWMLRLGDGTAESHDRAQRAADELWGYTCELFEPFGAEARLGRGGCYQGSPIARTGVARGVARSLRRRHCACRTTRGAFAAAATAFTSEHSLPARGNALHAARVSGQRW